MVRDLAQLAERLRCVLPDSDKLTAVRSFADGHSNETYLIEGLNLILRVPQTGPALLDARDVIQQAKIYKEVEGRPGGPPVPHVVFMSEDARLIGEPFFVMRRIDAEPLGETEVPAWFADLPDSLRDTLCRNFVDAVARVHAMAPLPLLGEPVAPQAELARWRRFARISGNDRLVAAMDRLEARPARISGPPTVVHGDCKPGNTLWRGSQIAALLDWELSLNGDPLIDLGYMLFHFPSKWHGAALGMDLSGMWSREQVIAAWEAATGRSAEGIEWYEAEAFTKIAAIISHGNYLFRSGQTDDPRWDAFGPIAERLTNEIEGFFEAHPD
ncbi:MAG: phosphotransferase family protein [Alphaproteobacteria bacterium]|nr:phosphotransferase family protein [Alphaproteobacteria bacterium]